MNKASVTDFLKKLTGGKRLAVIGIIGILLIGASSIFGGSNEEKSQTFNTVFIDPQEYKEELQLQIKEIVSGITGDKNPRVIVTLETGIRRQYAGETEDSSSEKSNDKENDSSSEKKEKAITVKTSDGSEEALIITEYMPQVRGVAIVCGNGENIGIKESVREAVTAALGITSKRVYIGGYAG